MAGLVVLIGVLALLNLFWMVLCAKWQRTTRRAIEVATQSQVEVKRWQEIAEGWRELVEQSRP